MDLQVYTPGITVTQAIVDQVIGTVGRTVFRRAVNAAYRSGARTVQQAIDYAVYKLREGPSNVKYTNRKRDIEGEIKPQKLNFDDVQEIQDAMQGDDIQFTKARVSLGRNKKRTASQLWKHELGRLQEYILRWQRCSASLLGPGATPISIGNDPAMTDADKVPTVCVPIHMMSLTNNNFFRSDSSLGALTQGMVRFVYRLPRPALPETFQGDFGYQILQCQNAAGDYTSATSNWQIEKGPSPPLVDDIPDIVFHKYTDIKLNLYGAMRYPLEYTVMIVTGMPLEMDYLSLNPITAGYDAAPSQADFPIQETTPLNEFLMDQIRPLLFNPIIGNKGGDTYKDKIKVLMKKKYKVPCLTYGDAINLANAASGIDSTNVKTVNLFLRHDRYRDYKWATQPLDQVDDDNIGGTGWDVTEKNAERGTAAICEVDYTQRVYLLIMCNSPQRYDNIVNQVDQPSINPEVLQTAALNTTGSYDIVVRNCFRVGSTG